MPVVGLHRALRIAADEHLGGCRRCQAEYAALKRVLRLAEAHDLVVVEDDTYAWLAPPHATRVAQLDGELRRRRPERFARVGPGGPPSSTMSRR